MGEGGATIEIERNSKGIIFIRHSQFQPKEWAELMEYTHEDTAPIPKLGAYVIIQGREFQISGIEWEAIKSAIKTHGESNPAFFKTTISDDERHATNELVGVVLTIQQYLATYGKMIHEMAQRRHDFLTPVQRETCPRIVKQIARSEARLQRLRRNLER
jgi:hypothetical protein